MKKGKKITLIVAGCMVLAGLIIAAVGLAAVQFDVSRFCTVNSEMVHYENYETVHYEIEEGFHHISIAGAGSDVHLYPSEYDTCRVVCTETKGITFDVGVKDDTLYIQRQGSSAWQLQFGVFLGETGISVYLPEDAYEALTIHTSSGNITVPEDFSFTSVDARSASGEITLLPSVNGEQSVSSQSGNIHVKNTAPESLTIQSSSGEITLEKVNVRTELQVKSTSGDIAFTDVKGQAVTVSASSGESTLSKVTADGSMGLKTTSGDMKLRNIDAEALSIQSVSGEADIENGDVKSELQVKSTSGDMTFTDVKGKAAAVTTSSGEILFTRVIAEDSMRLETTSGDIQLRSSDAAELYIRSSSGNVSGTLLSGKVFQINTTSGTVDAPYSGSGGKCEITTTSGDVDFAIVPGKP